MSAARRSRHPFSLASAAVAVAVAVPACGGRAPVWSEGIALPSTAFGLRNAVALIDTPADRVVLLEAGQNQSLNRAVIAVGHNIVNAVASPHANKLFVVSAGHRSAIGDDQPEEAPSLTVIAPGSSPLTQVYTLDADPLSELAIDPIDEHWAVLFAGSGPNQAFVQNPNELVFVDLTQPGSTPVTYTLHSFGGRPVRLTFTRPLLLPGGNGPQRLLIVESDQDLSLLRLDDPASGKFTEITVPLTSGTDNRRLAPAGVTVDDGDAAKDDDARIGVRVQNDPTVIVLQLGPDATGTTFRPTPNLTDVGGVPSDIAFVRTDGGLRLAALVPARGKATLIDPVTSLSTDITLPAAYQRLSLITDVAGMSTAAKIVDVALLWNGGSPTDGVAFWELGQTAGQPYRSIETVGVISAIAEVLDVPTRGALKVLKTASASSFYVLDLGTRTAAPLVTSTSTIALSMSPGGDRVWTFVPGGTQVAATALKDEHPHSLLIERPVHQVFEVEKTDGGEAAIVLHETGGVGATVYDAVTLDDQTRQLYSGLLTGGPYQ